MTIEAGILKNSNGIRHGFFTRQGGVSDGIYDSLNCGLGSKDTSENVRENRRRVADMLGADADNLLTAYQVHSPDVIVAESPWDRENAPRVDAIVTRTPGLAIGVLTADCVPVLFADAEAGVVGAAHAGWRGALTGVLESAIIAMEGLGAKRANVTAAIGPAISQDAYEVGEDFRQNFLDQSVENKKYFRQESDQERPWFDLMGYVEDRLRAAGLGGVENTRVCTYDEKNSLFSYRRCTHRSEEDYGRQISAILIP